MSEKLEQVARALAHCAGGKMIGPGRCRATQEFGWHGDGKHFDLYAEAHWREFLNDAGFAVAALRVPTEAMLAAVEAEEERLGYCPAAFETMGAKDSWPIMIDAVLK